MKFDVEFDGMRDDRTCSHLNRTALGVLDHACPLEMDRPERGYALLRLAEIAGVVPVRFLRTWDLESVGCQQQKYDHAVRAREEIH